MSERIDFGDMAIVTNEDIHPGDAWLGRADAKGLSRRLIEAFARGEVTKGGLAEAGWHVVGRIADDGPSQTYDKSVNFRTE